MISYRPPRRRVWNPSPRFLPSEPPSQEWVAYERRASDVPCRACSDALSRGGAFLLRPEWASHRLRDVRVRGVKNVDFDFEFGPCLKVRGIREEDLHALRCRGYTRLVERAAVPSMLGFNQAKLLARPRPEDKRTRIGYTRSRAQHAGSGRALGRREAGERRRRVLRQGTCRWVDLAGRPRLYHRRDDVPVRLYDPAHWSGGGARVDPV